MSGTQDYLQVRKLINMVIDMVLSKEEQYDHLNKYQRSKCGLKSAYEHGKNLKVNVLQTKIIVTYFFFSKWY